MATLTTSAPAPVAGTLPRARRGVGDGLLRQAILVALVGSSVGAHLASAASASGVMAWMMAGMGMACASCLIHLWRGTCAVRTAARHLLVMCAVMALFHMAWLTFPGVGATMTMVGALRPPDPRPKMSSTAPRCSASSPSSCCAWRAPRPSCAPETVPAAGDPQRPAATLRRHRTK